MWHAKQPSLVNCHARVEYESKVAASDSIFALYILGNIMKYQTKQIIKHFYSVKPARINKSYNVDLCVVFKVNKSLLSCGNDFNVFENNLKQD